MAFATYQAFRTSVENLIEGDDIGDTFNVNTLDLIIGLAEARVYRDLRASTMLANLSATVTSNAATLPSDLIELKDAWFSGKRPLQVVSIEHLRDLEADSPSAGTSAYVAQDGDTLRFWPTASGTVLGRYYKRPTDLQSVTPFSGATTFHRYPDLFVFASLVEAMPFLGMEARTPMWNARYQEALATARHDEHYRVYGAGRLRVRPN